MILAREKLDYDFPQTIEEQQPKPKRKTHKMPAGQKIVLVSLVLSCFVIGSFVAYYFAQVAYLGYKIDLLQTKLADLRLESHNLEQEVTKITSLEKVEAIAVNEMGMVKPADDNVVLLDAGLVQSDSEDAQQKSLAEKQSRSLESITLPQKAEKKDTVPNRFVQAFADMLERWNS